MWRSQDSQALLVLTCSELGEGGRGGGPGSDSTPGASWESPGPALRPHRRFWSEGVPCCPRVSTLVLAVGLAVRSPVKPRDSRAQAQVSMAPAGLRLLAFGRGGIFSEDTRNPWEAGGPGQAQVGDLGSLGVPSYPTRGAAPLLQALWLL